MKKIPFELGKEHCFQLNSSSLKVETRGGDIVARAVDMETSSDWVVVDYDMRIAWFATEKDARTRIRQIASESNSLELIQE